MASVTCAVDWIDVLTSLTSVKRDESDDVIARYYAMLLCLLVRIGAHSTLLQVWHTVSCFVCVLCNFSLVYFSQEGSPLASLLTRCEQLSWSAHIDAAAMQLACESYVHACDVTCVMSERTSAAAAVLR